MSYLHEQVVESCESKVSGRLEVWLAYGRYELNAPKVNYSYGELHKVFRTAFYQLKPEKRAIDNVLLLGLGAGSVVKLLRELGIHVPVTAVELDPEVVRLGKKYFHLSEDKNLIIEEGEDAIQWVKTRPKKFDLVVVDLFVDEVVPAAAEDPAFLQALRQMVKPDGMLVWNRLAHEAHLQGATRQFSVSMAAVFPGTRTLKARDNVMLVWENSKAGSSRY